MKVAIIGAGVSGLSCAYELERNGIIPVIYEKRSRVGEGSGFSGLWFRIMDKCKDDVVSYLINTYNLDIKPISRLNEIIMLSENKKTGIKAEHGYIFRRGVEDDSIENQLAAKIQSLINFDTYINISDIKEEYDHIVVATANPIIPRCLKVWTDTFVAHARIAKVLGDFKVDSATIWFNEKFSNNAFVYLIPNSSKEATVVLLVNGITGTELDYYWNKFMQVEDIKYHILQTSDIEHTCGFVETYVKDNIYFVGNSGGFTDDLIGIGAVNAIESAIFAARSIINGDDYNLMVQPIRKDVLKLHEFRKVINTVDNNGFDRIVAFLGMPLIKQFVYNNSNFKIHSMTPLAKFYNEFI